MDAFALASGPRLCFMLSLTFRRSVESPFWFVLLPNLGTIRFAFSSLHQVLDGYFVHYFAPKDLPPLPKNVVFVLDSSASMVGTKLRQVSPGFFSSFMFVQDSDVLGEQDSTDVKCLLYHSSVPACGEHS